jgi:hypothetical protein
MATIAPPAPDAAANALFAAGLAHARFRELRRRLRVTCPVLALAAAGAGAAVPGFTAHTRLMAVAVVLAPLAWAALVEQDFAHRLRRERAEQQGRRAGAPAEPEPEAPPVVTVDPAGFRKS